MTKSAKSNVRKVRLNVKPEIGVVQSMSTRISIKQQYRVSEVKPDGPTESSLLGCRLFFIFNVFQIPEMRYLTVQYI